MNKKHIKYIILSIAFAAGAVTAAAGLSMGAKKDYSQLLKMTDIEAVIPANGVASINIDVSYADIEITASNDASGFEIMAESIPRSYLKYTVSNNILNLKYSFNKWYEVSSVPLMLKNAGKIKITVPAGVPLRDIQIKSGMNKTSISYLSAENIYINCGSKDNNFKNINADYIEVNAKSGNTFAENITCEKLGFFGGNGNADITNFQTKNAEIKSGTGDIAVSGSLKGSSIFESGIGDINTTIYGDPNDYHITVSKGNAIVNGKKITGTESGDYKMNVTSGMGDVNFTFK